MTGRNRPSRPTAEDRALWDAVAKTVEPLRRGTDAAGEEATAPPSPPAAKTSTTEPTPPKPATRRSEPPRLALLDRRLKARIGKGTVAIDARVDLHGLTQAAAHHRLHSFLAESQSAGARFVLVITGKGGRPADAPSPGGERGVLRRLVPIWLASAELRSIVVGFEPAGRSHGGEGALYVRIRSRRKGSA